METQLCKCSVNSIIGILSRPQHSSSPGGISLTTALNAMPALAGLFGLPLPFFSVIWESQPKGVIEGPPLNGCLRALSLTPSPLHLPPCFTPFVPALLCAWDVLSILARLTLLSFQDFAQFPLAPEAIPNCSKYSAPSCTPNPPPP